MIQNLVVSMTALRRRSIADRNSLLHEHSRTHTNTNQSEDDGRISIELRTTSPWDGQSTCYPVGLLDCSHSIDKLTIPQILQFKINVIQPVVVVFVFFVGTLHRWLTTLAAYLKQIQTLVHKVQSVNHAMLNTLVSPNHRAIN